MGIEIFAPAKLLMGKLKALFCPSVPNKREFPFLPYFTLLHSKAI